MSLLCKCPRAASLTSIPAFDCPESFGQIQKVAFQRLKKTSGALNFFPTAQSIGAKATWTPALTAADDTKIVVSPYLQNPETEPGGPRTFGGGNETLGGIEEIIGTNPTVFTGVIRKAPQNVIKVMKELMCEEIGIFIFDENGAIGGLTKADGVYPIPIRSLFIGDKAFGGYDAPDSNGIQWSFLPNYSDYLTLNWPEDGFNPLVDLTI